MPEKRTDRALWLPWWVPGGLILFFLSVTPAMACGICMTVWADSILPPIWWWMVLSVSWFLCNATVRSVTGLPLPGQPRLWLSMLLAVVTLFLGAAYFGPALLVILIIPPLLACVRWTKLDARKGHARVVQRIACFHLAGLVVLGVQSAYIRCTQEPVRSLMVWGAAGPMSTHFSRLREQEPESFETYRYLLQHGSLRVAERAAQRLGEIGDPEVDLPLLRQALWRYGNSSFIKKAMDDLGRPQPAGAATEEAPPLRAEADESKSR